LTRFKNQFESNLKLWQVYLDEAKPHVLNKLTMSSQLMMNFPTLVAHQDVVVLMENVASHSFASFAFANTFGLITL
jgi:hypothetical protein